MAPHEAEQGGHRTGLTVTAAAFAFLVLRLFAVSGYNWHTAFAVLHTLDLDDTIGLVLGTVMAESLAAVLVLALLVPIAALRTIMELRRMRGAGSRPGPEAGVPERPDMTGAVLLLVAVVAVIAYVGTYRSWWLPVLVLVAGGLVFGIGYGLSVGGRVKQGALWASRHLVALVGLAMLIGAATITTPWLPLERIDLLDGTRLRAFVLAAEPGFLKVLTEQDREFHILTDRDVTSREEIAAH